MAHGPLRLAAAVLALAASRCAAAACSSTRGGGTCGCQHEIGESAGVLGCREAQGNKFWFRGTACTAVETECACLQTR